MRSFTSADVGCANMRGLVDCALSHDVLSLGKQTLVELEKEPMLVRQRYGAQRRPYLSSLSGFPHGATHNQSLTVSKSHFNRPVTLRRYLLEKARQG